MKPYTERFLEIANYLVERKVVNSFNALALDLGMKSSQMSGIKNGNLDFPMKYLDVLEEKYNVNKEYVQGLSKEMWNIYKGNVKKHETNAKHLAEIHYPIEGQEENPYIELPNGQYLMVIPLVQEYAYAGYLAGYKDPEYIEQLPKHTLIVHKKHSGRYLSIEAFGDSMDDGSKESIEDGDIITGRDLPMHHWTNRFHINQYKYWIIVHKTDGILVKRILKHDFENGIILCQSLNPDKDRYPDFEINLNDVKQMLNVVNISKPVR
ncbi:hypothetical protein [Pedobacter zeae]|uniref:Phage repressor protein C with HTH and peptisase S24 domain n=1 Tax=Pedobacter zeae TaxID=1737356 RepID=A0A7W6P5C7_9SPHI|nr:hypothetical protein [Pedobacter zeae]MBB4107693.1 phage repressor protein C with HTH and peptisase S24 domain [Pedobacter zeae]GGG97666.1 hypothetical protein GCM10007422_09590 [Pedobacter zeae]